MNQRLFTKISTFTLVFFVFVMTGFPLHGSDLNSSIDISKIVKSVDVNPEHSALIITCLEDGLVWTSGGSRIGLVYPPASTAKIPHTLIALEEGYADGPETYFEWDGKERFLEVWNRDQTLQSAFKNSVIWVYQQITRDLGYKTMLSWMDRLEYGNRFIGSSEDIATYWVEGPLMISAYQQIEFLSRLAYETLPLRAKTFRLGKLIMQEDNGEGWVLYAKTGFSGSIGWYVGWVETNVRGFHQTYIFAFNMDIENWNELPKRKEVVRAALNLLDVIKAP